MAGIDAPLSLVRMNYSDSLWTAQLVVLHNDWRGQYDIGSYAGGSLNKPCRRVVRSSNFQTYTSDGQTSDYPKFSGPLNANWFHCIEVEWPAPHVWVTRETRNRSLTGPIGWMGTLIDGMRDLSGQMYMRNRYYDPRSGRFTQEDPIGLAGGLNVYGFGNGDPVTYSDPYGLSAEGDVPPWLKKAFCILVACASAVNRAETIVHPPAHAPPPPGNPSTFRQSVERAGSGETTRNAQFSRPRGRSVPPSGEPQSPQMPGGQRAASGRSSVRGPGRNPWVGGGVFLVYLVVDHLTNPPELNPPEPHHEPMLDVNDYAAELTPVMPLMVPQYRPAKH